MTRTRSRPRGFTLIEVVSAIAAGSAAMGLATWTLTSVLSAAVRSEKRLHAAIEFDRLAQTFRSDARKANTVERIGNEAGSLAFVLRDGDRVEYSGEPSGGIVRIAKGGQASRTRFAPIAPNQSIQFAAEAIGASKLAVIRIGAAANSQISPRVERVLEAVVAAPSKGVL